MPDDSLLNEVLDNWEEQLALDPSSSLHQFLADRWPGLAPSIVDAFRKKAAALMAVDCRLLAIGEIHACNSSAGLNPSTS
jgi:hypothetical protein